MDMGETGSDSMILVAFSNQNKPMIILQENTTAQCKTFALLSPKHRQIFLGVEISPDLSHRADVGFSCALTRAARDGDEKGRMPAGMVTFSCTQSTVRVSQEAPAAELNTNTHLHKMPPSTTSLLIGTFCKTSRVTGS